MATRGGRRRAALAAAALSALSAAVLVACSSASGEPSALPVPTFATAESTAAGSTVGPEEGRLPDDCARVLAANDLGALFGLPLESVAVKTVIGAPAPAVGRTERLGCRYTRAGGTREGLLDVNVSTYTDAEAAARQWRTNVDAEDGSRRDVPLGSAQGVLVERPQEAVLMVANGSETLTFVLPGRVRIRDLSAGDTLVDLALRVLPAVSLTTAPPPPPAPAPA